MDKTLYLAELAVINTYKAKKDDVAKAKKLEGKLRSYFLKNSNFVEFTNSPEISLFMNFKWPFFHTNRNLVDKKTNESIELIKEDFVKTYVDTTMCLIEHETNQRFKHYRYKLSNNLKEIINKQTLVCSNSTGDNILSYLENPVFYNNNEVIGHVISHESFVYIYLDDNEFKDFVSTKLTLVQNEK
ncbi:hypothetical protein COV58_02595 [Candidatus Roizmanbacteria bacterium CG11_big_fil_rev_8_21_14_0_20_36_8]|uniref:Uncharacterized protein n=2 Tax=Candidatus Roizmaniibacteriota TaxID=1752723 RepID=A0A2M6IU36_9BACT|nr:MAG: hypothetical protein COV58_02595 [Candidatus Roizmanbacteria bacterium CG11_big_fil_rev_8_21_14_0_20_36_8]PIZ64506.1 MAG: hypothetical protein COY14_04565 [Candidatus Roizmanbacteria bacterium CG_4_10_14_0_2_um_filter_36_9]